MPPRAKLGRAAGTPQPGGKLETQVSQVLTAFADRLLGIASPQLSVAELKGLRDVLSDYNQHLVDNITNGNARTRSDVKTLMDTMSTKPALAALAKLAAFATRVEITGASAPREERTFEVAHYTFEAVVGLLNEAAKPSALQATRQAFRRLARTLLKAQTLHAAARQAAAAAAVLIAERGQVSLQAKSLARSLLSDLRESALLDHVGRLVMLLPPLPAAGGPPMPAAHGGAAQPPAEGGTAEPPAEGGAAEPPTEGEAAEPPAEGGAAQPPAEGEAAEPPAEGGAAEPPAEGEAAEPPAEGGAAEPPALDEDPGTLNVTIAEAYRTMCDTVNEVYALVPLAGEDDGRDVAGTFGPCAQHAVLTLWAATLAAADLQPCGLPHNPLPSPPSTGASTSYPCVDGIVAHVACIALREDQSTNETHTEPCVPPRAAARLLRRSLALAAASARAAGNSRAVRHGPNGMLSVDVGWDGRREGRAEFKLLVGRDDVVGFTREVIEALREVEACSPTAFVAEAASICGGGLEFDRGTVPALVFRPSLLPPAVAAALEGGLLPLLETVFRAAGDSPRGPEARMAASCLVDASDWRAVMEAALTHSPPRQAAAFLATLAKLLRRTQARSLLGAAEAPPAVTASCVALERALNTLRMAPSCVEPPGPLDPAAPCAPLFVHAAAALLLLPELSRLTREALELQLGMPERSRRNTASGQGALAPLLAVLAEAVDLGSRTPDCPEEGQAGGSGRAPTRLSSALCLPLLVEEAGAVPLLGAALALLQRHGSLPLEGPDGDTWATLGGGCLRLGDAFPELVRGRPAGSGSAAGAAWQPGAVRLLGAKLGEEEWAELRGALEGLAARLEQGCGSGAGPSGGAGSTAAWQLESERLAALRAELRSVLPACSNPACVSLAGDSEAGLRRHPCGGCGRAAYCCEQCRGAHWKAGHKKACGREGQGGG
ncbi:hypothetical protein HYH03_009938 [Edaphochlamys debaryana]|uniref:phytol kinase n=1 Tax=Edaphochlamys debaryana TaxID=47281 RepID=A0A835XX10_9CHLO|nr:hypothetical protein HYH03_009938 [Edaphochlamys debaryana]|eukprot:KAG2491778.1 hypothetical protein HYH03_009938 [Edaphochlamys debaryana]